MSCGACRPQAGFVGECMESSAHEPFLRRLRHHLPAAGFSAWRKAGALSVLPERMKEAACFQGENLEGWPPPSASRNTRLVPPEHYWNCQNKQGAMILAPKNLLRCPRCRARLTERESTRRWKAFFEDISCCLALELGTLSRAVKNPVTRSTCAKLSLCGQVEN